MENQKKEKITWMDRHMKYRLSELAAFLKREFIGKDVEICGCNTLMDAKEGEISFLANPKYAKYLKSTRAGAVILEPSYASEVKNGIISDNPYLDFAKVVSLFAKEQGEFSGISELSYIHEDAKIAEDVVIYPYVYIGPRAKIGKKTKIFSGVYIGEDVSIGNKCTIYPNVVIMGGCEIGNRVILHPGVVIGSDGFGFAMGDEGREKFPQIGKVVIEDDVEIGSNSTVDRAALGETKIGKGTKIDNLVQIGHNVKIGANSVLVAQVGIAGSTNIGKNVILAGQVGVVGHLNIADGVIIGAKSGVPKDIKKKGIYSGSPIMEHNRFLRTCSVISKLPEIYKEFKQLKKKLDILEKQLTENQDR